MMLWKYASKPSPSNGKIQCSNRVFGDPSPGIRKQCMCEPNAKLPPFRQAFEGDRKTHTCRGQVLYVDGFNNKNKAMPYHDAIKGAVHVKSNTNGKAIRYQCNNRALGKDPMPGHKKQCFCDESSFYSPAEKYIYDCKNGLKKCHVWKK
jgi:hypothetical protein